MRERAAKPPSLVPFPRFFAVVGFTLFSLVLIFLLLEMAAGEFRSFYQNRWHSELGQVRSISPEREYACRGTGNGDCPAPDGAEVNFRSASPAYDGYPWAEQFWREERSYAESRSIPPPYAPFRIWGMAVAHWQNISSVETGARRVRRTVNHLGAGCVPRSTMQVWFFGGSAAWGRGVPDFATIPSYLSEKLNAVETGCVQVINFGVEGYDSNQDVIYLLEELRAGSRPNLVIFYDGYNDAYIGVINPASPEAHFDLGQIRSKFESTRISWSGLAQRSQVALLEGAMISRLQRAKNPQNSKDQLALLTRKTLDNYEGNLELARALAQAYGFEVRAFWQPNLLYGHKPMNAFEEVAVQWAAGENPAIESVYEEAARRSQRSKNFIFLGRLFEQTREPIYIDPVHLGPRGNQMVADAIAKEILPRLQHSAKGVSASKK